MQCLAWAFSKPRGSKQEPFSSTALWSKSWPQRLPPPSQAPLGAAGGGRAVLTEHLCPLCRGLLCTRSIRRAETAKAGHSGKGGKAGGHRLSSQKQHCCPPFLSPTARSPGSFSASLPWDISLALGATKSPVALWSLLYSPRAVTAWTERGHATLPRAPPCAKGTRAGTARKRRSRQEPAA